MTTAQVSGSTYITCSGTFSGSGTTYIQTPSIENWHVPIRACVYPVESGYYCHDRDRAATTAGGGPRLRTWRA
uniref:hypothetical protein n=1 Tax=Herbidospora sakaeratensis TaxID=564415 RepID=UPI0012F8E682|nr:hypothetical protein [Herbidospora sakaeratensis]